MNAPQTPAHASALKIMATPEVLDHLRNQLGARSSRAAVDILIEWATTQPDVLPAVRQWFAQNPGAGASSRAPGGRR